MITDGIPQGGRRTWAGAGLPPHAEKRKKGHNKHNSTASAGLIHKEFDVICMGPVGQGARVWAEYGGNMGRREALWQKCAAFYISRGAKVAECGPLSRSVPLLSRPLSHYFFLIFQWFLVFMGQWDRENG